MVRAGVLVKQRLATHHDLIIAGYGTGSKYFKDFSGIATDVALIEKWDDMQEFMQMRSCPEHDTIR